MVALDCDTAVTRDFSAEISADTIRRCDSLLDPLDINEWKYMYGYFGLAMPNDENGRSCQQRGPFHPKKGCPSAKKCMAALCQLDYRHVSF
ncbi:hypothetical protein [Paenibacillus naphthalenovorans]|uniref:hypothetical protein n=1 Tax=Paenibacillus naphthalenovorans TaxID=162209 RepID=UPI003D296F7F